MSTLDPFKTRRSELSEMNDYILILLTILVATNAVLVATLVFRPNLAERYASRFSHAAAPVESVRTTFSPVVTPVDASPAPTRADTQTGLLLPAEWLRIVGDEDARIRRYGRPATIVLVELDGLDRLISALGEEAGDRILLPVADALSHHARGSDHLARLDLGRFGILLTETGEVEAVNYVERIRSACDLWLESGAISLRLAIGWAAPPVTGTLEDAVALAEERLSVELRRSARQATEATAPVRQATPELAPWPSTA